MPGRSRRHSASSRRRRRRAPARRPRPRRGGRSGSGLLRRPQWLNRTIVYVESGPVLDFFLELAAIPSPPGEERAVADAVLRYLRGLGLEDDEDDCGERIGLTMGDVYGP